MKKIKLEAVVLLMFGTLFAMSCNKKEDNKTTNPTPTTKTTKEKLLGTWNLVKRATDDNSSGAMDESEKYDLDAGDKYEVLLNADGTGSLLVVDASASANQTFEIKWELKNNDADMNVITPAFNDTSTVGITSLTDTELVMWDNKDEPTDPKEWAVYNKK